MGLQCSLDRGISCSILLGHSVCLCLSSEFLSFIESAIWTLLTYYTIGFAPAPSRFFKQFLAFFATYQTALSLFRLVAATGRMLVFYCLEVSLLTEVSDCSPFPYRWNVLHLKSDAWNNQV
uniref:ABC-2 type transporter transmembrane domain-containing protein n=1 Tax=Cucumis sativus TaxID=3659 RepID=A0A0A0K677_CUCSA